MILFIVCAVMWFVFGYVGSIYLWTTYDDYTTEEVFLLTMPALAFGPFMIVVIWFELHPDRKIIIRKRE